MKDYVLLKQSLDDFQYKCYEILMTQSPYALKGAYNLISEKYKGFKEQFPFYSFVEFYLRTGVKNNPTVSDKWESEVIRFLKSNPTFESFVKDFQHRFNCGDLAETVVQSYLIGLKNHNSKGLTRLDTLYHQFLNYKNTELNSVLYEDCMNKTGVSSDCLNILSYEDTPFYETSSYKEEVLLKERDNFIRTKCKKQIERICSYLLFSRILSGEKFSYAELQREALEISAKKYCMMQLYRIMKKLHKMIFIFIRDNENILSLFNDEYLVEYEGKNYSVKEAMQYAIDNFDIKEVKIVKQPTSTVFKNETDEDIKDNIIKYCRNHHIPYECYDNYGKTLIKLMFSENRITKTYKTYIYSGGGFKDFRTGKTGFYKEIFKAFVKRDNFTKKEIEKQHENDVIWCAENLHMDNNYKKKTA